MNRYNAPQHFFRIVTIGEASVGKTSLIIQLTESKIDVAVRPTVSANFRTYTQEVDSHLIELQIWDTAGQERFRALSPIYYRGAEAGVAVFAMDNTASLDVLPVIIKVFLEVSKNAFVVIVGNKTDLDEQQQGISRAVAEEFAHERGWPIFFTSAKNGDGVKEVFRWIAEYLIKHRPDQQKTTGFVGNEKKTDCC
jgi:small GTP-binding protein